MAQKYSGWFLEKLFPAWLFMSFYHGFCSGTGELNSRNHMKHAEWFHPWAKHAFIVGKEMLVGAHMQLRASSPWPELHLLPSLCREVQPACWAHLFIWRLPSSPGERLVWVESWTWVGEVVWSAPCCQSHSCTGIADETCRGLWPLSHWEHHGARLFLATHSENWNG